ncbi:MAG: methyltransferase domain-containing protein, partial [Deltaproteobacteria bacterium]|nr:methyltransferase domain-containing protein [Deltaproteobacteria bacterium]
LSNVKAPRRLIELGCGNGRDSVYIAGSNSSIEVLGVDLATREIDFLNECYATGNVKFASIDFTRLGVQVSYDFVYSRFTLHAVDEQAEDRTIEWISRTLNPQGLLFIEVRSSKDRNLKKVFANHHYRRYIDFSDIRRKLLASGLKLIETRESRGLAKFEDEDPFVIRIVAEKTQRLLDCRQK